MVFEPLQFEKNKIQESLQPSPRKPNKNTREMGKTGDTAQKVLAPLNEDLFTGEHLNREALSYQISLTLKTKKIEIPAWQFFTTFFGDGENVTLSKVVGGLQLGSEKVTLNHLVLENQFQMHSLF